MSRNIATNIIDLNNDDYVVIDKDTGTVLGTNLALVCWNVIPEETRYDITSSDSAAWDYATEHGIPLHKVDAVRLASTISQADAWKAVADHPLMRRAMASRTEPTGLGRVLAELDRLHALDQSK